MGVNQYRKVVVATLSRFAATNQQYSHADQLPTKTSGIPSVHPMPKVHQTFVT